MKKFLSVFLSCILLLSSFSFVNAEDTTAVVSEEVAEEKAPESTFITDLIAAIEDTADEKTSFLMEQLDVLKAVYPEIKLYEDLDGEMSRADFLVMLAQLTVGTGYTLYTDFGDVDSENTALLDSLGYAVQAGLVSKSDRFRPDDAVTYHEMYKMAVAATGYEPLAQKKGGWPMGYIYIAHEIGLADDIEGSMGAVSAKDAYRLLYNVITVNFLEPVVIGAKERYAIDAGKCILEDRFGIRKVEGIVYANQMTSLTKGLDAKSEPTMTIGTTTFANKTDKNLLGYNVRAFLYDEGGADELISVRKYKNEEAFISEFNAIRGLTIEAVMPDGDTEEYDLYKGYAIILNDIAAPYIDLEDYTNRDDVTLRLIDNNMDGNFDVVKIYTWQYLQIGKIDIVNKLIFDANTPSVALNISDDDAVYKFYDCNNGVVTKISLNDLMVDDVLTYIVSDDLGSIVAFRSNAKVTGTYSAKNTDDNSITVGDKEYSMSIYANDNFPHLALGSETTLGLDATGLVVAVSQLGDGYLYGWIVASDKKGDLSGEVTVKMFTQAGEMEFFPVAERIYIDNAPKKTDEFYQLEQGLVDDRFVKYGVNADGELNMVDFPTMYSGTLPFAENMPKRDCFILYYDDTLNKSSNGAFDDKFMAESGTIFFSVPETKRNDDEIYRIKSYSNLGNSDFELKAYDIEPGIGPKVALMFSDKAASTLNQYTKSEVVLDVVTGIDDEGAPTTIVKTYNGSAYNNYYPHDELDVSSIKPGDIVRISAYKNKIYEYKIDYSFITNTLDSSVLPSSSTIKNCYYRGYVYGYGSRMLHLWDTININSNVSLDSIYGLDFRDKNAVFIDVYKDSNGNIKKVMARYKPISEIRDFLHSGTEADFMIARMTERSYVTKWIYRVIEP